MYERSNSSFGSCCRLRFRNTTRYPWQKATPDAEKIGGGGGGSRGPLSGHLLMQGGLVCSPSWRRGPGRVLRGTPKSPRVDTSASAASQIHKMSSLAMNFVRYSEFALLAYGGLIIAIEFFVPLGFDYKVVRWSFKSCRCTFSEVLNGILILTCKCPQGQKWASGRFHENEIEMNHFRSFWKGSKIYQY